MPSSERVWPKNLISLNPKIHLSSLSNTLFLTNTFQLFGQQVAPQGYSQIGILLPVDVAVQEIFQISRHFLV